MYSKDRILQFCITFIFKRKTSSVNPGPNAVLLNLCLTTSVGIPNIQDSVLHKPHCCSGLEPPYFREWDGSASTRAGKKPRQTLQPLVKTLDLHIDCFTWYQPCLFFLCSQPLITKTIYWTSAGVWWELWWHAGDGWIPPSYWELRWRKRTSSLCGKLDQKGWNFGPQEGLGWGESFWVPLSPAWVCFAYSNSGYHSLWWDKVSLFWLLE